MAATIAPRVPLGHCSGATGLDALGAHEAFSLHPLMTVPSDAPPGVLEGAGAAVAGSTPRATSVALTLAELLGMRPIEIDDDDRVAYHAAASIASNFLVALEDAAERVAATAGLPRELLAPLVRATVENWARLGSTRALTGPVARGDAETVRAPASGRRRAHAGAAGAVRRARRRDPRGSRQAARPGCQRHDRRATRSRTCARRLPPDGAPGAAGARADDGRAFTRATCR